MKQQLFLLGEHVTQYSFSEAYFTQKFEQLQLTDYSYRAIDLPQAQAYTEWINQQSNILGFNITIPYKESLIPYIDQLDPAAQAIGAVNTVKVHQGKTTGYNTDWVGFKDSLSPLLKPHHTKALVLGTGGASKAILYALEQLNIDFTLANRTANQMTSLTYQDLTAEHISSHAIIIQCTPVGTYPNITDCLDLPYDALNSQHILYDLVYNPETTAFMHQGLKHGTTVKNGYDMLVGQAEMAWKIWTSPSY